jgi:IclR family mhp operon transcriptional activator
LLKLNFSVFGRNEGLKHKGHNVASYKPVTSVLRGLEVLASVNRLRGKASVGKIHRQTGFDKATIVRMLETLISSGYVLRNPSEPVYSVSGKTLMLSASFDRHKAFGDILAQPLNDFRAEIGWPSDVALLDNDAMLMIESSRQGGPLSFNRSVGFRAPVLGTSLGLAYLANCTTEERKVCLDYARHSSQPWDQIVHDLPTLDQKLAKIREDGFVTMEPSYSEAAYSNLIFSIGVPIKFEEVLFATINVIYLKTALSQERARREIFPRLKIVAEDMAKELAFRSSPP